MLGLSITAQLVEMVGLPLFGVGPRKSRDRQINIWTAGEILANRQMTDGQICKHTHVQMHKYTNIHTHRHINT